MYMLLALATAVNDAPVDRPPTSLSSTTIIMLAAVFAFLIAVTALSGSTMKLIAGIMATAFRALLAEVRGLIMMLLALLFVLAMLLSERDHTVQSGSLPPPAYNSLQGGELLSCPDTTIQWRRPAGTSRRLG